MQPLLRTIVRLIGAAGAALLLFAIAVYRVLLSPLVHAITGSACRFQPTCSAYAAESIRLNGPWRGARNAVGRVLRCHPLSPGGFDPPLREPHVK